MVWGELNLTLLSAWAQTVDERNLIGIKDVDVKATTSNEPSDFSLVLGGPLYQLYLRMRLARAPIELLHRRIIAFALIAWARLWLLTAISLRNSLFISASGSRFRNSLTAGRFANQYAREEFINIAKS